jgi:hypothetical protein
MSAPKKVTADVRTSIEADVLKKITSKTVKELAYQHSLSRATVHWVIREFRNRLRAGKVDIRVISEGSESTKLDE